MLMNNTILSQMLSIEFVLDDGIAAMIVGILAFEGQFVQDILLNPRKLNNGLASTLLIAFVSSINLHLTFWSYTRWQTLGAINSLTFCALKRQNSYTITNDAGKILKKILRGECIKFKVILGNIKLVNWLRVHHYLQLFSADYLLINLLLNYANSSRNSINFNQLESS